MNAIAVNKSQKFLLNVRRQFFFKYFFYDDDAAIYTSTRRIFSTTTQGIRLRRRVDVFFDDVVLNRPGSAGLLLCFGNSVNRK